MTREALAIKSRSQKFTAKDKQYDKNDERCYLIQR